MPLYVFSADCVTDSPWRCLGLLWWPKQTADLKGRSVSVFKDSNNCFSIPWLFLLWCTPQPSPASVLTFNSIIMYGGHILHILEIKMWIICQSEYFSASCWFVGSRLVPPSTPSHPYAMRTRSGTGLTAWHAASTGTYASNRKASQPHPPQSHSTQTATTAGSSATWEPQLTTHTSYHGNGTKTSATGWTVALTLFIWDQHDSRQCDFDDDEM